MATFTIVQRNRDLEQRYSRTAAQFAREASPLQPVRGATPAGDERKLRGIPVLARGVGGAINGSRP